MKPIIRFYVLYSISEKIVKNFRWGIVIAAAMLPAGISAQAQQSSSTVKITPLGQRTGEFCARDRALIFEDPTGVRVLYEANGFACWSTVSNATRVRVRRAF